MPATLPPGIRLARVVGLLGTGILFGTYYTSSVHVVPALTSTLSSTPSPSSTLSAFQTLQARSHRFLLWTITGTASSFALVTYHLFTRPGLQPDIAEWGWFAAAAGITAFVVPYSKMCMKGVNREIRESCEKGAGGASAAAGLGGAEVVKVEKVRGDLEHWKKGNMVRAIMCLVAGVAAGWAGGNEIDVV